jgi:two-component system CheB/CheR fusion protein
MEAFFSAMPSTIEDGAAFVVVQHLAPDRESILGEIIGRHTQMVVREVEDGMSVEANCVYIIPPTRDMALLNGTLHLFDPSASRGLRLPIDFFFRSLAQDLRERAICIILSGTGSDGTLGVRAVKGEGGMVMVQNPESTEFDGMPRSAIATGLADYVLPPAEMPAQLVSYINHAFGKNARSASSTNVPSARETLKKICVLLRSETGHDFSQYKENTLIRRIERRMAVHQLDRPADYLLFIQRTPGEVGTLFRELLIGVTSFFRDVEAFDALRIEGIPLLFSGKPPGTVLRVWVCGCSTGEEAYSLAILFQEHMESLRQGFGVQVFATDIDNLAIAQARGGVFPASIAADVSQDRLSRFFTPDRDGGTYRAKKVIRDLLVFSEQDVIKDPPFSKLDLICCRNLLIYMDTALQRRLISLFHYALNADGLLFLGTSETVGDGSLLFSPLDRKAKLFRRRTEAPQTHGVAPGPLLPPTAEVLLSRRSSMHVRGSGATPDLREVTEQAILQHLALTGVLVDGRGEILHVHGRTGKYLEVASGDSTLNMVAMARDGLRRDLEAALQRAIIQKEPVHYPGLRVKTNGDFTTVDLTVRPMVAAGTSPAPPDAYLVILEESRHVEPVPSAEPPSEVSGTPHPADGRVAALERELQAKDEYLRAAVAQMETANEELKSANEEMQSVNEELQSTNEELETSKEELQSTNEELSTVNAELQTKLTELSRANNDMNNLLAGTGVATLFVDHQLRIVRFTPAATKLINLIPSDIGRPVEHIVSNLKGYDRLGEDVRAVLSTLVPWEKQVQSKSGSRHLMRVTPYRTLDNVIEGAVITFMDIGILVPGLAPGVPQDGEAKYRALFEKMTKGVVYLDRTGHVAGANPAAESILGAALLDGQDGRSAAPPWEAVHEDGTPFPWATQPPVVSLESGSAVEGVIMGLRFPGNEGIRWILADTIPLAGKGDSAGLAALIFEDITTPVSSLRTGGQDPPGPGRSHGRT